MSLWTKNASGVFVGSVTAPTMQIGDPVNNTVIEPDGTVRFNGNATVWDDLPPIPLLVQRQGSANNPALTTFLGNTKQLTFAVNDYVYGNYEMLHDYKEGSTTSWHVHWVTNGSEGVNKYIKLELEYTISNGLNAAPFTAVFPATQTLTVEIMIPANTPDKSHIISSFGVVAMTNVKIGAYVTWFFRRITATGAAPAANPFFFTIGAHIEKDTCGSRQMYIK